MKAENFHMHMSGDLSNVKPTKPMSLKPRIILVMSTLQFAICKSISISELKDNYFTYPLIHEVIKRITAGSGRTVFTRNAFQKAGTFANFRE